MGKYSRPGLSLTTAAEQVELEKLVTLTQDFMEKTPDIKIPTLEEVFKPTDGWASASAKILELDASYAPQTPMVLASPGWMC